MQIPKMNTEQWFVNGLKPHPQHFVFHENILAKGQRRKNGEKKKNDGMVIFLV